MADNLVEKEKIDEFVRRTLEAARANVTSIILFGSAASGNYHSGFSDLNLFCIVNDTSFAALKTLAPVAVWWEKQKNPPPLCMTRAELERSTDVFTIELLDMKQHHRLLFGGDVLQDLHIPMDLHRVQVEYELREKLVLLRQHMLVTAESDAGLWNLLLRSAPSFATLFRHALIALGEPSPSSRMEAVKKLAEKIGFQPAALLQVLDARDNRTNTGKMNVPEICSGYLMAIEKVTAAVDQASSADLSGPA